MLLLVLYVEKIVPVRRELGGGRWEEGDGRREVRDGRNGNVEGWK